MRLKKEERLRGREGFQRVFQEGRSLANRVAALHYLAAPQGELRLGVAVSRRMGCAVVRNRLRRRLREVLRLHRSELTEGWHVVVVARQRAGELSYKELEEGVLSLLDRAGVRKCCAGSW